MSSWPLSTLDAVSWVMDRPDRPLDFTLIVHSPRLPDADALRIGAASALNRFPVAASTIDGRGWTRNSNAAPDLARPNAASPARAKETLETFIDGPMDLSVQIPVRQLLIEQPGGHPSILATRCHHAAMDGRSAAIWLAHQFAVAAGIEEPAVRGCPVESPSLRRPPIVPVARAQRRRAAPIWHRPGPASRARRWHTIQFPSGHLRRQIRRLSAFTYTDFLATVALDTCAEWNRSHAGGSAIALWLPVEIRRAGHIGFGNGTSRIRVRAAAREHDPFPVKCRHVHDAISDAMRSGEWRVPEDLAVMRLPAWLMKAALRLYFTRPGVDVGSIAFSHVEHRGTVPGGIALDRVECVGPLHANHPCAIYGVTRGDCTSITFTYDPGLLTHEDVGALAAAFQARVVRAARELTCAA